STPGRVFAAHYRPDAGWEEVMTLDLALGDAERPRVAIDDSGAGFVIWAQPSGFDTIGQVLVDRSLWMRRFVPGTGWGHGQLVDATPDRLYVYDLTINASGMALVFEGHSPPSSSLYWFTRWFR